MRYTIVGHTGYCWHISYIFSAYLGSGSCNWWTFLCNELKLVEEVVGVDTLGEYMFKMFCDAGLSTNDKIFYCIDVNENIFCKIPHPFLCYYMHVHVYICVTTC